SADNIDASYWVKNLLQTVRFADAIESLFSTGDSKVDAAQRSTALPNVIVEVGPHSALQNPIKQTVEVLRQRSDQRLTQFTYLASLVRGKSGDEALLGLAGSLFSMGSAIKLGLVNQLDHHSAHVLTDLPAYAWDKSVSYVHKSRIMQEKLHPGQSFAQLLGSKSLYGNGSEPTFRQVFTLDDIPWIRDHNVGGHVIFPMTGYLSMAIEALRRVSPKVPESILVREYHVKRSLDIEEGERIDITTKLRPVTTGTESYSTTAWVFEINSWTETNGWTAHCHGQVEAEASEMTMESPTFRVSAPLIGGENLKESDAELIYSDLGQGGTLYGPSFQAMRRYWEGPSWTVLETELRDLDLISNKIEAVEKQRFTIVTRLLGNDTKAGRLRSSIAVFSHSHGSLRPVAEWESVTYRSISSSDTGDSASSMPAGYCWDLIPSLDFVDNEYAAKMVTVGSDTLETARQHRRKVNRAGVYYMHRALEETAGEDLSHLPSHLLRYFNWSKKVVARENLAFDSEPTSLLTEVSTSDAQGEMLCAVGEQLVPILRGEVQPLEIMLKDNLLMRNYEQEAATTHSSRALGRFVCQLSDIKPDLRVLEIGGGTASATLPVLDELSRGGQDLPAFLSYTFTDISTGFFENARTKLAKWAKGITYKKLDISQDPVQQGFATEQYDVVIASNVLHATPNIATTLDHVRSLLKPNGKLLLMEAIIHPSLSLPYSLLPGWWLSEDEYRDHEEGPLLSEEKWQSVLTARGFSGVDAAIADYPGTPEHVISVICSTRIGIREDSDDTRSITICGLIMDEEEEEFAQLVSNQVTQHLGCPSEVKPFAEMDAEDNRFCIFIDSPRQSILGDLSAENFEIMKNTLLETEGLLWVVPEGCPPEAESIKGLLRSLRHETESKNLLVLEKTPCTSEGALAIAQVAGRLRDLELANAAGITDQDFVWHNGMIHLPRFRQLKGATDVFASEAGIAVRKMQTSLEMTVDAAGSPDSIYFRENDVKTKPLGDDEVLIRVEAAGVNFRDLLLVLGSIPWTRPGFEGAGVVTQMGSGVGDLKPGDRVFYGSLAGGSLGTFVRLASYRVLKIPNDMSSTDAASIPVAYSTAIFAIIRIGRLRKGESVLIHAASGAVGQACIVLAQHLEARIFATAGTPAKREFLRETYGIPEEQIFSSRTPAFRDGILNATDSQGVDVIVNSLSGNLLQETWDLIGDFGRFVEIGKRDLLQNSYLGMRPFDRNVTFSGVDLRTLFDRRPEEEKECLAELVDLVQRKVIVPIRPVTAVPISQLAIGLRKLQSGQNIGKIVVTLGPEDTVLADCPPTLSVPSGQLLRPDATYLITGGTGGIGISLASWMVKNGALNVVLLGRSGSSRPEVKKLLEQYEGTDVQMRAVACDVGSRTELVSALQSIKDLPPVRGVVHGALYLRDSLLANATYEDWQNITRPRVQGAWNLHELLEGVDFFIALSSFVGAAGNLGQGIYAGTATYFDAFARYRIARGKATVAMALPVVLDVGYAAEKGLTEALKLSLGATLTEADLHTAVKGAIIGPSSNLNEDGSAIAFRFSSGEDPNTLGWQYYHPLALAERVNAKKRNFETDSPDENDESALNGLRLANSGDPLLSLLDALMDKVSSITMIERDEVEPDAPLAAYGLDSLVSVELRNWIRRETGVETPLPAITRAENLRALATYILSQRETSRKS
ncbi:Compactin diketide synthase mokB, partial [Lachnellula cervina]